ncbi:MAG: pirin family protein [Tepidisphaeraceae bacterium]|jgi:hypothetical protein
MIQIIPSSQRHHADHGWLDTHWHFSFGDYVDRKNMHWGALRVFNDDTIRGGGGFDFHPHHDMEIVTIVLRGELEHQDNLGNRGVIRPGEVQVMSAGKGIFHAERNFSETEPCQLLQVWIMPRHHRTPPRWEQKRFDVIGRRGKLMPVVSAGDVPQTLSIDQDAQIYLCALSADQRATHALAPRRKAYLFVIEGHVDLNGNILEAGDQARIADESQLDLANGRDAELILLDLP